MRQDKFSRQNILLYCLGMIPVTWLALLIAPYMEDGLAGLIRNFGPAMENPFHVVLCADSGRVVAVLLLCYALAIGVYLSTQRNYRRREEHGSAKWGWAAQVNRKYADAHSTENKILTQNVAIGLDGRKHRRNLNTLVCGGSGAGKTRFFAKPNLCQANSSYVVLDPKGELLVSTGKLLEAKGYSIRVLDLINMDRSHCYNPFVYLRDDNDIQRLVTNLFKNTTPKGSQSQDPFWDQAATMLLLALVFYLHYEAPPEEQNFPMVMEMIRAGDVREDDDTYKSALDILFERLEMRNPEHIALKYYRNYHSGSGKTLKSIQITLISRLEKFNLDSLASITQNDELELWSLGEQKTAIFAVIPDNDSSFNFLVGMLYTQLFQQLYHQADFVHDGRLPVPVHFLMDEFANVALPDEFDKLLSTITADFRKYPCIEDSIADHSAYLLGAMNGNKLRYDGLKGCNDYKMAIQIIKDGGYATSTTYVSSLCSIIEKWNLTQYDAVPSDGEDKPASACTAAMVIAVAVEQIDYKEKRSNSQLDDKSANAGSGNYTKYARDFDQKYPKWYNGKKNGLLSCTVRR